MSIRVALGLAVASVVVFPISGCTVNGPDPGAAQPPTASGEGSGLNLPQRPRDLKVAGLPEPEICQLLTTEQKTQAGVGGGSPAPKDRYSNFPGCTWLGDTGAARFGIGVAVVPVGIKEFQKQKLEPSPETAATYAVAGGFGAVQAQAPGAESTGCVVDVDAAEGQTLEVNLSLLTPGGMNNQEMCARAKQIAELAVTTLQGKG